MDHDEYLYFLRRALDGMVGALEDLGDDLANTPPPLPGANSAYAIAFHCTAVAEYWIGHIAAGRPVDRERASEFTARGTANDLKSGLDALFERLREDLAAVGTCTVPANTPPASFEGPDRELTSSGVLLHVLEELAQHHGQVEIGRDLLLNGTSR
ncbi:DinB family protein [Streptomyces sp. NBC_01622]|uniref:DinB family protein n=1 Tax=Streptomyces sp. NBC_01622 TaxID=2975903 RepID=UPI003866C6CA|nr:DinB family protein [Streptomyces sp. NBC_01622]